MEEKKKEDNLHAVWFAAGTLALVACLQRATTMVSLVEQWRVWVFIALNLLLLAILFTSTHINNTSPSSDEASSRESKTEAQHKESEREKGRRQCGRRVVSADKGGGGGRFLKLPETGGDEDAEKSESPQLSKEELNERVEAFIATFRQQLVSDTKGRSRSRFH